MPTHSLIVGGTGMLRGAVKQLLNDFDIVSVIARTEEGFEKLEDEAGKLSIKLNRLQVDYSHYHELTGALMNAVKDYGEISMVVSWVHSTAPIAPLIIAKVINHSPTKCDYFEVIGGGNSPADSVKPAREEAFKVFENIIYHKIILGFIPEKDAARWLTDNEISRGVIEAVKGDYREYTVGST